MSGENDFVLDLLRLSAVPGVGPNKMRALIARFRTPAEVFGASVRDLVTVEGIDSKTAASIKTFDGREFAQEQLRRMAACGARVVTFWDREFPDLLKQIYDPPALLFVRGTLKPDDKYAVAIVGSRLISSYGEVITQKLTRDLAGKGVTVVSGLAYGIDTLAHATALKSGSRTIAVLGSGVDVIYPRENARLAERIVENGALVSEFPLGSKPERSNFPRRNRIICGMSLGVVVVEAGRRSGALITAAMALEQNREVFAVPGNVNSPNSVGTNELIRQGATLVTSAEDILEELGPQLRLPFASEVNAARPENLTEPERKIFDLLSNEPRHIDAIAAAAGESTASVLSVLLGLELKNAVKQLAGKMFVRI